MTTHILHTRELDHAGFNAALDLRQQLDLALDPHLPPSTAVELRARFDDDRTEHADHDRLVAFDDDQAVAIGHVDRTDDPENPTFGAFEIEMLNDQDGLTAAVLSKLLDIAAADDRSSILAWGPETPWRLAFYERLGIERRYSERLSELDLTAVDEARMAAWIDRRMERASDIRLVQWQGACPERWLPAYIAANNAMNDAPREGIELQDWHFDAKMVQREEQARQVIGEAPMVMLAVDPSGAPVGATAVMLNLHRPRCSWQYDTVVLPAFRNRGVGRWLKAAMWRRLRDQHPGVTRLRTGNAESNAAMLAINVAMGYRQSHVYTAWQGHIDAYREGLARLP